MKVSKSDKANRSKNEKNSSVFVIEDYYFYFVLFKKTLSEEKTGKKTPKGKTKNPPEFFLPPFKKIQHDSNLDFLLPSTSSNTSSFIPSGNLQQSSSNRQYYPQTQTQKTQENNNNNRQRNLLRLDAFLDDQRSSPNSDQHHHHREGIDNFFAPTITTTTNRNSSGGVNFSLQQQQISDQQQQQRSAAADFFGFSTARPNQFSQNQNKNSQGGLSFFDEDHDEKTQIDSVPFVRRSKKVELSQPKLGNNFNDNFSSPIIPVTSNNNSNPTKVDLLPFDSDSPPTSASRNSNKNSSFSAVVAGAPQSSKVNSHPPPPPPVVSIKPTGTLEQPLLVNNNNNTLSATNSNQSKPRSVSFIGDRASNNNNSNSVKENQRFPSSLKKNYNNNLQGSFSSASFSSEPSGSIVNNQQQQQRERSENHRFKMADRFVNDILNDSSPMVTTSRYTEKIFAPPPAAPIPPKYSTSYNSANDRNRNQKNSESNNNNNNVLSGSLLQKSEAFHRQKELDEAKARGDTALVNEIIREEQEGNQQNREEFFLSARTQSVPNLGESNRQRANADDDGESVTDGSNNNNNSETNFRKQQEKDSKSLTSNTGTAKTQPPQMEAEDTLRAAIANEVAWMLRFALLFINFTFIVAALLMTLAGSIATHTPSLVICEKCQNLAVAPVVLGFIMWFSGLFAFYWIKQRNILPLLLHTGIMLVVALSLVVIIIVGIVFDGNINHFSEDQILQSWTGRLANVSSIVPSPLCALQTAHNCSGIVYGCCDPGLCYNASRPPAWVGLVCPDCGQNIPSSQDVCQLDILQSTSRSDMQGFIIVLVFALVLIITGMGLAMFVRRINNASS